MTSSATLPVRKASSAAAAGSSATSRSSSWRSDCASCGVTVAILSTSAGRLRNAMPRPAASRMGKMNTQNNASGSRMNSRNRTRVSCASGCSVQAAGRGDFRAVSPASSSGTVTSLIAQVTSRQGDEDVLQGSGMREQLSQRNTLPPQLVEQGGHGAMELGDLHLYAPVLTADIADALDLAQRGDR